MKKFFLLFTTFLFVSLTYAQIPAGYYDRAQGLNGAQLKTELHYTISGHTVRTYTNLWTDFQSTDKKVDGKVWDMYSDVPGGTPPYEWTFGYESNGGNQCGNYSGEGSCYNREHSFPKSWFGGEVSPMYTELFHIYPTDGYVNSKRSNYPFGEVNNPSWTSLNGSKVGTNTITGYSGTVFEPIDEYKGDFARTYFYMATRYENVIHSWSSVVLDGSSYPVYTELHLDMLIRWHEEDPVSQKETDRNNAIWDIQRNRNPFIDHPDYVAAVWGTALEINNENTILSQNISIYPNPTKEWIQLKGDVSQYSKVIIYNYLGQVELEENVPSNRTIYIGDLKSGIYILQVKDTDSAIQNFRLLIQ